MLALAVVASTHMSAGVNSTGDPTQVQLSSYGRGDDKMMMAFIRRILCICHLCAYSKTFINSEEFALDLFLLGLPLERFKQLRVHRHRDWW